MNSQKEALINQLFLAVQRQGTLTVLHTHAIATKIGLSATEFECLDTISQNQPMTAGKLATMCGLTTGAITGIVDRLERSGFACRVEDPDDRRRVLLRPVEQPEVSQKVRELYRPMSEAFNRFVADYSVEELQFLVDGHKKMNDAVQEIIIELNQK
jgi:DNA-binding MarR family transcriptional regulator